MPTLRSGWTNVRVCNDCKKPIGEYDLCDCPFSHPFRPGASVTLCRDPAREVPAIIGTVGRVGNGAWRLLGTGSWFDLQGDPRCPAGSVAYFARLTREGDAAAIQKRRDDTVLCARVERLNQALTKAREEAAADRSAAAALRRDAFALRQQAAMVDPAQDAERAAAKARADAMSTIKRLELSARDVDQKAAARDLAAEMAEARVAEALAALDALPPEVRATYLLGGVRAVRQALLEDPLGPTIA